jgi:hypothetical protein
MDLEAARDELRSALAETVLSSDKGRAASGDRLRGARDVLIAHGIEVLGLPRSSPRSLDEIIGLAAAAPVTRSSRAFAVLLIHALGSDGVLPSRGPVDAVLRRYLERMLLNPLRRAGYPFDGTPYEKRQALARMHATIDEHLHPLEPSIPSWLHGPRATDRDQ